MAEKRPAAVWIATCLGTGFAPVAPGTFGSLWGVGLVAAIGLLPTPQPWKSVMVALVALGLCAIGIGAAGEAEKYFGRTDPGQVVIDEVVGQMITLLARPDASWEWLLAGFVLFRAFDILKPFPARRLERAPAGWGIMLDDVAAGGYGLIALTVLGMMLR